MVEDPRNITQRQRQFARLNPFQRIIQSGKRRRRVLFGARAEWAELMRKRVDPLRFDYWDGNFSDFDLTTFDAILPIRLEEYDVLRRLGPGARRKAILPDPAVVDLCDDKAAFNRTVLNSPFAPIIPHVYDTGDLEFPLIVKKKRDEFGINSFIFTEDNPRILQEYSKEEYFIQEIVAGDTEHSTHLLMKDGEVKFSSVIRFEMEHDIYIKGPANAPKRTCINKDRNFVSVFAELLRYIGFYDGTCCVNYKVKNGIPKIFEINPRYGASLTLTINPYLEAYISALRT